jgi:quercetin 2,3-dioxygenase
MTMATPASRTVDRVHGVVRLGPDAQVDDKALVVQPGDWRMLDPFLVMVEDWFSQPGFDWHPHRGLETVTLVLDGALEHGDNRGRAGVLEPGDVQWMTAGSGIIHRELAFRNEHAHTLQLWVNLPSSHKMVDSRYQDLPGVARPAVTGRGATVSVISGQAGEVTGPAELHWPITGLLVTLEPGAAVEQALPDHDRAFAYVLAGRVDVAGRPLRSGQVAWSDPVAAPQAPTPTGAATSTLELHAPAGQDAPARLLLFSGRPIGEPVVAAGPFVMNSHADIEQAWRDFHAGRFGDIPRLARLGSR